MTATTEIRPETGERLFAAALALSTGLVLGAVDAAIDSSVRSSVSASPLSTWTVLGTSSLAGALAFLLLWASSRPFRRFVPERGALGLALAAAVLTVALPALLECYRAVDQDPRGGALALPAAAVVATGVYLLARPFGSGPAGATSAALFAVWLALAALVGCTLLALQRAGGLSGALPLYGAGLAAAFVVAGSAWRLRRARELRAATLVAALLFAGAVLQGARHVVPSASAPASKGNVPAGRKPRQVILVVVDTLRADHLTCQSPSAPPTPALDAVAAQSVHFERSRAAAPWTFPSVASILTGLAPSVHLGLRPFDALPEPVTTLAERLSRAGFLTAAFVRNPALRRYTEIDRGFDEYHYQREPHPPSALAEILLRRLLPNIYEARVGAPVQTARVAEWLAAHKDRDFFLWVHYFDPHMSYNPPRAFQPEGTPPADIGRNFEDAARVRGGFLNPDADERSWIRQLYAGEVRATDEGLAGLFRSLEELGLWQDATLVFTADHGDELWEHDAFEHGHTMYDEVLSVPLFVKLPGGALAGRVAEPVSNASVAATVLEVAGVPYVAGELSAPPLVRRSGPGGELYLDVAPRPLFSSGILYFEARTAVVFEGFKYIQFHVSGREELYDLAVDPGELHNLAQERPDLVLRAKGLLASELEAATELRRKLRIESAGARELDAESRRDLRGLGYVDK